MIEKSDSRNHIVVNLVLAANKSLHDLKRNSARLTNEDAMLVLALSRAARTSLFFVKVNLGRERTVLEGQRDVGPGQLVPYKMWLASKAGNGRINMKIVYLPSNKTEPLALPKAFCTGALFHTLRINARFSAPLPTET